jgi:phospholipid-binding lipoprotein MlaA
MRGRRLCRFSVSAGLAAGLLAGCASGPIEPPRLEPPQRPWAEVVGPEPPDPIRVYDPIGSTNRRLYKFNAQFDRYILLPVVDVYEDIVPSFLRDRVSSFFLNLGEINNFANSVLQANSDKVGTTLVRFVINSTVGIAGLFDPASELGFARQSEDFGQSLGRWGVGDGPYVVLPFLGPSNLRDTFGWAVDAVTLAFAIPAGLRAEPAYYGVQYGLRPIDARSRIPFSYHETGSPFEYELLRYLYTEARRAQIAQ